MDNEVKGEGNSYTTEFRQYDPRLVRLLSLDPEMKKFPWMSPYVFSNNSPLIFNDVKGDIPWPKIVPNYNPKKVGGLTTARDLFNEVRPHHGLDIAANPGSDIHVAATGKVIYAGPSNGYGNIVVIDHGKGYVTLYAHMKKSDILVKEGQLVTNDDVIAKVGSEGRSKGPHLHVEFIYNADGSNKYFFAKGVKNSKVYDPRTINDLQNVIDGKEEFKGEFLTGGTTNPNTSPTNPTVSPAPGQNPSTVTNSNENSGADNQSLPQNTTDKLGSEMLKGQINEYKKKVKKR
jgi:murein DD-endopeptidase MepM/ murein hydrolase activator NlpD